MKFRRTLLLLLPLIVTVAAWTTTTTRSPNHGKKVAADDDIQRGRLQQGPLQPWYAAQQQQEEVRQSEECGNNNKAAAGGCSRTTLWGSRRRQQEGMGAMLPPWRMLSVLCLASALIAMPASALEEFHHHHDQSPLPARIEQVSQPSLLTSSLPPSSSEEQQDNMLDEVWSLVDKYYLNRQSIDWEATKQQFAPQFARAARSSPSQQLQVVTKMVESLGDKYSRMLDPDAYAAIQKFDLIGVGVTLMPDPELLVNGGMLLQQPPPATTTTASDEKPAAVVAPLVIGAPPIPKSAAEKAGLRVGDVVLKVNGETTQGRSALDIVDQLANEEGDEDTKKVLTLSILPKEHAHDDPRQFAKDVTMQRSFVQVQNPIDYQLSDATTRSDGTRLGYIRIAEFNSLVLPKLQEALQDLEARGANAYVLDVRQNTGGAFQSAVEVSSLFFSDRVATIVVDNAQTKLPFTTAPNKVVIKSNEPVAIWMDDRSASASEVFAGSLHDNCRAALVGSTSFGKGLIQAVYGLKSPGGAGLVLTVARYNTPKGNEIQGTGLQPDIEIDDGSIGLPFLKVLNRDTSKIDFDQVRKQLAMCEPPATTK